MKRDRADAPRDRGGLVGIIFFILGLGTLLPWNFFMTASMPEAAKEYYFNNWMTLLSQLPLLLFTLLNSFLYQRISEAVRIAGSLVFVLLLFIITAVFVKVDMENDRFFSVTMATIWFINCDADTSTAALGYFITPCVGTLVTLFSYALLPRLSSATESSKPGENRRANGGVDSKASPVMVASEAVVMGEEPVPLATAGASEAAGGASEAAGGASEAAGGASEPTKQAFVTSGSGTWERYFISVCCFLVFNVFDWLGRTITTWVQWPGKESPVFPALVVSRLVFVPLLMLCNVQGRWLLPVYFPHDVAFAAIMAAV
ncbi:hypothetical protein CRUP_023437 [Coryphaenoides rupestris]|nr:hypothetical protein CRUP_023437 [Coryphaenoides rupestris]